jgi:exosortase K
VVIALGANFPDNCKSWIKKASMTFVENKCFYITGLFAAVGLKYFYSSADADALKWILTPVARLVTMLNSMSFEWESHAGFVNHYHGVVIAPACAGVNFLIICFATIFFTFVSRIKGGGAKCGWFAVSVITAYLIAIFANTMRIIISIFLYGAPIYGGPVTPGRVHELAGTLIFIFVLVGTYMFVERIILRFHCPAPRLFTAVSRGSGRGNVSIAVLFAPFAWYVLVTVIVPLLNGAAVKYGAGFSEHSFIVLIVCGFLFPASVTLLFLAKKNVDRLNKTKEKEADG